VTVPKTASAELIATRRPTVQEWTAKLIARSIVRLTALAQTTLKLPVLDQIVKLSVQGQITLKLNAPGPMLK
jgi:hypothetical protein